MYDSIDEALEELSKILEYVETIDYDDTYHLALEFGHEFKDELQTNSNEF